MNMFLAITLVVLAVAIAVVPAFSDCQSQGKAITLANGSTVPMKCHWTGVAEIGVGIPLAGVGIMTGFSRRKSNLLMMGIMGSVLGIMAVLFPTHLIGVCANMASTCNTVEKPSLIALGSVAIVGSLGAMVLSRRTKE
jgi:hypothetical protein